MSRQFSIISAGPGQPGLLTGQAREAIVEADEAYACGRVAGALAALRAVREETARLAPARIGSCARRKILQRSRRNRKKTTLPLLSAAIRAFSVVCRR